MFHSINFSVGKKTLVLYDQELLLGELSVQVVNIPSRRLKELYDLLNNGQSLLQQYLSTKEDTLVDHAHSCYRKLEEALRQYPLIALLLNADCLLPKSFDQKAPYYLGTLACLEHAAEVLDSIQIFHKVIDHFIKSYIMPMRNLTTGNLSGASAVLNSQLYRMYLPKQDKPGFCPCEDGVVSLDFEAVENSSGVDGFQILETYTTESLLMLLRIDFYKALEAGHLIRQCEYCGRFFLLTRRLHTKYCDNPAPDNPKYTCAQMGYRKSRRKEQPQDDPKADSLRRCLNRITQDCSRKIITAEERDRLKTKAHELYHEAKIRSGVTYEEFEKSLASGTLYPLCHVKRKSNPVGHPKTEKVG